MGSSRAIAETVLAEFVRPVIVLPFPHSALAGHNAGAWRGKSTIVANHRLWAANATREAKSAAPADGDIAMRVRFYPANKRGDRINFPIRMKPYFDGIADALKVNDSRFLPTFEFCEPDKHHPRVEVVLSTTNSENFVKRACSDGVRTSITGSPT